jgi:hypothetical protein
MAPQLLNTSLGALEMGVLISTTLFGVMSMQTYIYITSARFQSDRWLIKLFVAFVWWGSFRSSIVNFVHSPETISHSTSEAVHTVVTWSYLYGATVTKFGQVFALFTVPWDLATSVFLSGLVCSTIQSFFFYRIYIISSNFFFALSGWFLSFFRLAITIALTAIALQVGLIPVLVDRFFWMVYLEITILMALDTYNAFILIFYLCRRRSQFRSTSRMVDKIMLWTIETGALTSLSSTIMLICSILMPNNMIWLCIYFLYPNLYSNSLFVL